MDERGVPFTIELHPPGANLLGSVSPTEDDSEDATMNWVKAMVD